MFGCHHCERVGRPYEAITRSNHVSILIGANEREVASKTAHYGTKFDLVGTPDAIIDQIQRYAQIGSQYVTFTLPDAREIEPILLLGNTVVPGVAAF
jgi:alkanesulfonate monooxygenase SsuD/methylene tetrahydromethanopterin reductase-like flavin-dependent oxidoreductase (luciferase family)